MDYKCENLGKLIYECSNYDVNCISTGYLPDYFKNPIQMGKFVFSADKHSTGISLTVVIVHPDTHELYTIIQKTYWYNEGRYGFNKVIWLKGEWDDSLKDAIRELREQLSLRVAIEQQRKDVDSQRKNVETDKIKQRFEDIFRS